MPQPEHRPDPGNVKSLDELKELNARLDRQLERYSNGADGRKDRPTDKKKFSFLKVAGSSLLIVLALLLPFLVLIRTSLHVYAQYQWNGWLALAAGVGATVVLLLFYAMGVAIRFGDTVKVHRYIVRGIIVLVVAYCGYGLLYLSSMHVKQPSVQSYYHRLHPLMRITVTTASLFDSELVITDIRRSPGDYRAMGLEPLDRSMHYPQPTGYVHAVDIRTIGKPEWKNWLIRQGLELMGYRTLRHVGTADHLHVSLPLNDS